MARGVLETYAQPMTHRSRQEEAKRPDAPARLEPDTPAFFGSSLASAARRIARHFEGLNAGEAAPPDAIETWGRRIGRTLGLVACIGLGVYLYVTYLR
ncbi:MAG TPA: hypothetical protein VFQ27_02625 [Xanthobacteraceae bacterium]|nr:hypothetical protein [Xanthobacteraceae bacterium]